MTIKGANSAFYSLDKTFGETLDFTMQVDCTALSDLPGYYGIAFRMEAQSPSADPRYVFVVAYLTGSCALAKVVGGKMSYLIPWGVSPLLKKGPNQTNRLMLDVVGDTFTVYVNGYYLNRARDGDLRIGVLRIFGQSADKPNVPFVFNDFRMSGK